MNMTGLLKRVEHLEAQRKRRQDQYLSQLSNDDLQLSIDGLRALIRGEAISDAHLAVFKDLIALGLMK